MFKENLKDLFASKKGIKYYILIYAILLGLISLTFFQPDDFLNPKFELLIFIIVTILGSLTFLYYSKNKDDLHKVALIIILIFGIVCVFLTPMCDVCDEAEHFVRTTIVADGQLGTNYIPVPGTEECGYLTTVTVNDMFYNYGDTFFNSNTGNSKINYNESYVNSAFSQNPFYGYALAALGVLLAQLLNLNAIWMLWLGRLFNLILYAGICTIAIKKAPKYKLAMLVTCCLPLAIYQGASVSIDCIINAFAILAIGYFLKIYYTAEKSITWLDLGIFFGSILIAGIIKFPYLFLTFLILIVPNSKFNNKNQIIISRILILISLILGVIWTSFVSDTLNNSWRLDYYTENNVSPENQIDYILNNPISFSIIGTQLFYKLPNLFIESFYFSTGKLLYGSKFMGLLFLIIFWVISFIYPIKRDIKVLDKIKTFIVLFLIYSSTILIQYLSWSSVGSQNILDGVLPRYFIPLLIFIPIIFNLNNNKVNINKTILNDFIIIFILIFISSMIMLTVCVRY